VARVAYVNGQYLPLPEAGIHIEDSGFQFADGVYEVLAIHRPRLLDEAGHLDRLDRSLGELAIARPVRRRAPQLVMRELVETFRRATAESSRG
jgi:D-alanine transaminase